MTVKCSKIQFGKVSYRIVQWNVKGTLQDYEEFISHVKQLDRKEDTLLVVLPVEFHPLQCMSAFIHATDSFRLRKNRMKTLDLQALSILYGESQIKRIFESIKRQVIERGSFNVCIIYPGEHPGPQFLPVPPETPENCSEPLLDHWAIENLVDIVKNYINIVL
jgi:hypothetical protein